MAETIPIVSGNSRTVMDGNPKDFDGAFDHFVASSLVAFPDEQIRITLILAIICSSFSLIAAALALRWFLMMRRSFRHRLLLLVVAGDTFKSFWYLVTPIVAFSQGPIKSASGFCQSSGFFLAFGVEASDFSILVIALHAMLQIFGPQRGLGEDGLYPYRLWIYILWFILPLLSASLAFTNPQGGYVSFASYCYLPKRPIWYRLALAWIPRYLVFVMIVVMYSSISLYVHIKFRGFKNVTRESFSAGSQNRRDNHRTISSSWRKRSKGSTQPDPVPHPESQENGQQRRDTDADVENYPAEQPRAPWEGMSFLTTKPPPPAPAETFQMHGVTSSDFAPNSGSSSSESELKSRNASLLSGQTESASENRKTSEAPTSSTGRTDYQAINLGSDPSMGGPMEHPQQLDITRHAIRRQLRFLFIYPAIYLLMWIFPFVSHCLVYNNYYVTHPPYWLYVLSTCILALQGSVNSIIFSWKEKPWNRIDGHCHSSTNSFLRLAKRFFMGTTKQPEREPGPEGEGEEGSTGWPSVATSDRAGGAHWWEEEGRKRKDSVWLGTDAPRPPSPVHGHGFTPRFSIIEE